MTTSELKNILIYRIAEIKDVSFLKALKTILDSRTESDVIQLTPEQIEDIIKSKKEIIQGSFIENSVLNKEIKRWLKAR